MAADYATITTVDGNVVCERCLLADSLWLRVRGLLGRKRLEADEGILLRPAWSIHMFFMRFPIDAVFVDRELTVLRIRPSLAPWRAAARWGAHAVLELPAGACARRGLKERDSLRID